MKTNIKEIFGNWASGRALDKHTIKSVPLGLNQFGYMQYNTTRTEVGEALYKLKNQGDWDQVALLADALYNNSLPTLREVGLIVPVPASRNRAKQPVHEIAKALAVKAGMNYFGDIVRKTTAPNGAGQLKNLETKEEKQAALQGRFSINDEIPDSGKWSVLVIDDIHHTGATLEAVCETLATYPKIDKIHVAVLTWR